MPETKRCTFAAIRMKAILKSCIWPAGTDRTQTERMEPEDIDFILVPGICYDRRGYRIGYGGGYYDRYLAGFTKIPRRLPSSAK
ncbi:5-formyltetrahydrofolate cyclo-ligase [Bacillus licheniformis]|nr:5-formyltetrahydrofolate cyclo-ligase [Bacillus licheniformis]